MGTGPHPPRPAPAHRGARSRRRLRLHGRSLAAYAPAHGRITVHPTPVAGAAASLAHDLLRSVGKHLPVDGSPEAVGWAAQAEIAWRTVAAWIPTLRIGHVVVTRAHRISSRHFEPLFALRELTACA